MSSHIQKSWALTFVSNHLLPVFRRCLFVQGDLVLLFPFGCLPFSCLRKFQAVRAKALRQSCRAPALETTWTLCLWWVSWVPRTSPALYLQLCIFNFLWFLFSLSFSEATILMCLTCPLKVVLVKHVLFCLNVFTFDKWYGMSLLRRVKVFITFIWGGGGVHPCHSTHGEVKGQLMGISPLPPLCGAGESNSV